MKLRELYDVMETGEFLSIDKRSVSNNKVENSFTFRKYNGKMPDWVAYHAEFLVHSLTVDKEFHIMRAEIRI